MRKLEETRLLLGSSRNKNSYVMSWGNLLINLSAQKIKSNSSQDWWRIEADETRFTSCSMHAYTLFTLHSSTKALPENANKQCFRHRHMPARPKGESIFSTPKHSTYRVLRSRQQKRFMNWKSTTRKHESCAPIAQKIFSERDSCRRRLNFLLDDDNSHAHAHI